jgi:hypothetical protein
MGELLANTKIARVPSRTHVSSTCRRRTFCRVSDALLSFDSNLCSSVMITYVVDNRLLAGVYYTIDGLGVGNALCIIWTIAPETPFEPSSTET